MIQTTIFNILNNSGAEFNYATDFTSQVIPDDWTLDYGDFTAVAYAIGGSDGLNTSDSAAIGGGNAYFAGGLGGNSEISQSYDLSSIAGSIDTGATSFDVSGYFGGYLSQNDSMSLTLEFQNSDKSAILKTVTIGGVTAADRGGVTELLERELVGSVPVGTRWVTLLLDATKTDGAYNDGYADKLSLGFTGPNLPNGTLVVTASHDYSSDSFSLANQLLFQTTADSVATFTAEEFQAGFNYGASIDGDAFRNTVVINIGSGHAFDGRGLESGFTSGQDSFHIVGSGSADTIFGTMVDDLITGGAGDDQIFIDASSIGFLGADTVVAGDGNDLIRVGVGFSSNPIGGFLSDQINGGAGVDTIEVEYAYQKLKVTGAMATGIEILKFDDGTNFVVATRDAVVAAGATLKVDASLLGTYSGSTSTMNFDGSNESDGHFVLIGGINGDRLGGGALSDTIDGGAGRDTLSGRGGADTFVFDLITDTAPGKGADNITDFTHGDLIDLHAIDANTGVAGDQSFHMGVTHAHAGDIVVSYNAGTNQTTIKLYVDGDKKVDGEIILNGDHHDLTAADFIL